MDTGEAIQDPNTRRIKTDKYKEMVSRSPQHIDYWEEAPTIAFSFFESTYLLRNLLWLYYNCSIKKDKDEAFYQNLVNYTNVHTCDNG